MSTACNKYKSTSKQTHRIKEVVSWEARMETNTITAWKNMGEIRILIKTILKCFLSLVVSKVLLVCQEPSGQSVICQASLWHFMCFPEKQHTIRGYSRNKAHNDKKYLGHNRNSLLKYREKRKILTGFSVQGQFWQCTLWTIWKSFSCQNDWSLCFIFWAIRQVWNVQMLAEDYFVFIERCKFCRSLIMEFSKYVLFLCLR